MSQKPFTVEYAKSSRASCKKCKGSIEQKTLRIARNVKSPFHDGFVPQWHHPKCLFKTTHIPESLDDVEGFNSIKWDDQERLTKLIQSAAEEPEVKIDVTIDYAKNNRNVCKICNEKIMKDDPKIGISKFPEYEAYLHVKCWDDQCSLVSTPLYTELSYDKDTDAQCPVCSKTIAKGEKCRKFNNIFNTKTNFHIGCCKTLLLINPIPAFNQISGADDLEDEDSEKLKTEIPQFFNKTPVTTSVKKEEIHYHPLLKEQAEEVWKVHQILDKYNKGGLAMIQECNNLKFKSVSPSTIVDTLSDAIVFGLPSGCPICKQGTLIFENDAYKCRGSINEWTPCFYKTLLPERIPIKFPDDDDWKDDFKEYNTKKFKTKTRLLKRLLPKEILDKKEFKVLFAETVTKKQKRKYEDVDKITIVEKVDEADICVTPQLDPTDTIQTSSIKTNKPIIDMDFLDNLDTSIQEYCLLYLPEEKPQELEEEEDTSKVQTVETLQLSAGGAIDPDSGYSAQNAEFVFQGDKPFNATLTLTDAISGRNTYYKIQLIKINRGGYLVYRKYGRIGTSQGGQVMKNFSNKDEAIREFNTVFTEKTGNQFDAKKFEKKPNLFFPIELDYGDTAKKVKNDAKCNLPMPIQELLTRIFDVDMLKSTLSELKIDTAKMPLGKISKNQIMEAYTILNELDKALNLEVIDEDTSKRRKLHQLTPDEREAKIVEYTNRFYSLIPQVFKQGQIPLINTSEIIQEKIKLLDVLRDIEITNSIMNIESEEGVSVLDGYYAGLKSDIEVVEKSDPIFSKAEKYMRSTHGETHYFKLTLNNLYRVKRHVEVGDFKIKLNNHKLLWHGTRTSNIASILATGLRIAPPEAPVNGYMFGKGVYFADMVSKSAGYCYPVNNKGYLFLCDVALGELYKLKGAKYIEKLPDGYGATHGQGRTVPDYSKMEEIDGVEFPGVGKSRDSGVSGLSLQYNEFIVYNIDQIKIKYLLDVEFDYSSRGW